MSNIDRELLLIAGSDPSGEAGLYLDIKVADRHNVDTGCIITSITAQNHEAVLANNWIEDRQIINQLESQLKFNYFTHVKIGLFPSISLMLNILQLLKEHNPDIFIVWDPVLASSSGYAFHKVNDSFIEPLEHINLFTPNYHEAQLLTNQENPIEATSQLSHRCPILLKGGHRADTDKGVDILFQDGKQTKFAPSRVSLKSRRGTGCVLSTSIAIYHMHEANLLQSIEKGKAYTYDYIEGKSHNFSFV